MSKKMNTPLLRGAWMGLVLILLIALLPTGVMAITYVYSPMVIEEAGEYQLANDITNYDGVRWQNGTDFFEPCIKILASDVIFDGNGHKISGIYNATRVEDQVGIYVDSGLERVSVIDTKVDGFNYGIYYYGVNPFSEADAGGRIWDNTVSQNDIGIILDMANNITVVNNTASNTRHKGIVLDGAILNWVESNTANNNVDTGIYLQGGSALNTIIDNTAQYNVNSSSTEADDITLRGSGIVIDQSSDNQLIGNFADSNNLHGIAVLPGSTGNVVRGNSVQKNGHTPVGDGIYVDSDQNTNHVVANNATNNIDNGIHLIFTDGSNKIVNNIATGNGVAGISLEGCRNNIIGSNTVINNKYGIEISTIINEKQSLVSSDGNTLFNNTALNNTESGIYFNGPDGFAPLINNILDSNTVKGNGKWGIHLQHSNLNKLMGNTIENNVALGILVNASAYNTVFNNYFLNSMNVGFAQQNNPNTWNVLQEPNKNIVNGPFIGGNWWGKPDGTGYSQTAPYHDNGFCDVEFYVGPENIDKYPLHLYSPVIPLPVPAFSGTPTTGTFPLTVTFTDLSTPSTGQYMVTGWDWNFGDGTTHSTLQNPIHVYLVAGNYNVTLVVTNPGGNSTLTKTAYITTGSTPAPKAAFTMAPGSGPSPLTVQFIDQSTGSPTLAYSWDFGDSSPVSPLPNPEHTYTGERAYTVNLTVTNAGGSSVVSHDVVVGGPVEPIVAFTAMPRSGTVPLVVSFLDQSTADPYKSTYAWDFGDGAVSTERNPAHQYSTSGSYDVTLTVTTEGIDPVEREEPGFIVVNIPGTVTADFAADPSGGTEPTVVQFLDHSSGTPAPTSWLWDFDDPYASTIEKTSSLQSPVHTYLKAGKFYPKLTASNSQGSNIKVYSDGVYIRHTRPTAAFSASPTTGYAPFSVNFTDQSIGQALTAWEWNFGDGGLSDIQSPVYTFNKPGNWSVTFRSYNDGGWSDPIIKENLITVIVTPVTAGFVGSPVSGSSPLTVSFTDQSMGNPTNWSWDFGDSTTPSTLQSPQHIYLNEGNYTVKLTASKVVEGITYSNVITKENYIHAGFAIQPAFTGTPTSGLTPLPVQFTDQSTGSPTSWFWDFGDGQYSSVQNPSHTYISTGSFPVTLTISKLGLSQSLSKPAYIQVGVSPFNADFEADQTVGLKPLTVDFTDETTGSPLPTQWTWSFGDGGSSIAQNPTHIYTQAGSYTVTLTARNEGQTSTKEKQNYITVTSEPTPPPVDPSKIELKTGWNFVSTPKTLASGSNTGMIFSGVNMGGRSAWIWDGSMSPPQWVPVISTTPIRPLWGIWIYSTSSTVVNLNFDPASQSLPPLRNLPAGWNGIGFTGVTQQPARNTYLSVKPNWTTSMGFNAATQKYDPTIFNGDPQTEFTLQYPTKGYWLYMMTPGNLSAIGV